MFFTPRLQSPTIARRQTSRPGHSFVPRWMRFVWSVMSAAGETSVHEWIRTSRIAARQRSPARDRVLQHQVARCVPYFLSVFEPFVHVFPSLSKAQTSDTSRMHGKTSRPSSTAILTDLRRRRFARRLSCFSDAEVVIPQIGWCFLERAMSSSGSPHQNFCNIASNCLSSLCPCQSSYWISCRPESRIPNDPRKFHRA